MCVYIYIYIYIYVYVWLSHAKTVSVVLAHDILPLLPFAQSYAQSAY